MTDFFSGYYPNVTSCIWITRNQVDIDQTQDVNLLFAEVLNNPRADVRLGTLKQVETAADYSLTLTLYIKIRWQRTDNFCGYLFIRSNTNYLGCGDNNRPRFIGFPTNRVPNRHAEFLEAIYTWSTFTSGSSRIFLVNSRGLSLTDDVQFPIVTPPTPTPIIEEPLTVPLVTILYS